MGPATWILARLFGSGPVAEVAARGVSYLGGELRDAITHADQPLTKVRLQPGETYTVVAYPKPTRRERKLAKKQTSLLKDYKKLTTATSSQKKAARRLGKAQRRLRRARPGTSRHDRRERKETRLAFDFDRAMRPSKKQIRTAEQLDAVSRELDALRAEQLRAARASKRNRRKVNVYSD